MGIEEKVSLILRKLLYFTVVFTLNHWLQIYRQLFLSLLFVARKVTKEHSVDKISCSLLGSRIFAGRKYPSFVVRLSATSPTERLRESVQVKPRNARQKNLHTLIRALTVPVACDFDNAVFFLK